MFSHLKVMPLLLLKIVSFGQIGGNAKLGTIGLNFGKFPLARVQYGCQGHDSSKKLNFKSNP